MTAVVDANCWCLYVDEEIRQINGLGKSVFKRAEDGGGILFDDGNLIRQQYIDMRKPYAEQIFDNWIGERIIYGIARIIKAESTPVLNKTLRVLNVPQKEHIYFKTAIAGKADYIVSIDSDFFDPSAKLLGQAKKREIVSAGSGPVCKHARKEWSVKIYCPEEYAQSPT